MKHKKCPECGSSELGDRWSNGRKLRQHCEECDWIAEPRVPEKQKIEHTKMVFVDEFGGFNYEVFDKYGHAACFSETFNSEKQALKDLENYMKRVAKCPHADEECPMTAILWPAEVLVVGKKLMLNNGKLVRVSLSEHL